MNYFAFDKATYDQFGSNIRRLGLTESQKDIIVSFAHSIFESDELTGRTIENTINKESPCVACNGTGVGEDGHVCPDCNGTGKIMVGSKYLEDDPDDTDPDTPEMATREFEVDENGNVVGDRGDAGNAEVIDGVKVPETSEVENTLATIGESVTSDQVWSDIAESIGAYAKRMGLERDYVPSMMQGFAGLFLDADPKLCDVLSGVNFNDPIIRMGYEVSPADVGQHTGMIIEHLAQKYHEMSQAVDEYLTTAEEQNRIDAEVELSSQAAMSVRDACRKALYEKLTGPACLAKLPADPMERMYADDSMELKSRLGRYILGLSDNNPFAVNTGMGGNAGMVSSRNLPGIRNRDGSINRENYRARMLGRGKDSAEKDSAFMAALGGGAPSAQAGAAAASSSSRPRRALPADSPLMLARAAQSRRAAAADKK